MKEIEFRGKFASGNQFMPHPNEDKWVYGDLLHKAVFYCGKYSDAIYQEGEIIAVNQDTIGQYTGLNDKNDVRIFEGDVVVRRNITFGTEKTCMVVYNSEIACFRLHYKNNVYTERYPFISSDSYNDGNCTVESKYEYEVIGNIYDNPELLNIKSYED